MFPEAIPMPLYEASDNVNFPLGTVASFRDASGNMILARYMSNNAGATLAAGQVVVEGAPGKINGVQVAGSTPVWNVAGGLAASLASVTGSNGVCGWVIFRGPQTNASASASTASSAGTRALAYKGADVIVAAATYASTTAGYAFLSNCAILAAGDALAAAASNTIYWTWR